jgi:hypothetical protein
MAASGNIRQLKDKRKRNVTLFWVPGYAGITGNKEVDEEAKRALEESIPNDEKYPPEDLSGWVKTEIAGSRKGEKRVQFKRERRTRVGKMTLRSRKRRDHVAVTRLRTGYSRATHRYKMEGTRDPDCPFCSAKLTLDHILWHGSAKKKRNKDERSMG